MSWIFILVKVIAVASVPLLAFSIGIRKDVAELLWLAKRPWLAARSLFAVLVVVPVMVLVLVQHAPIPLNVKIGLTLLAISPGPVMASLRAVRLGGIEEYSHSLQVLLLLLSGLTVPLTGAVFAAWVRVAVPIPIAAISLHAFRTELLPLAVGLAIRRAWPEAARRIHRPAAITANCFLLALAVVLLIAAGRYLPTLTAPSLLIIAGVALLSALVGIASGIGAPGQHIVLGTFCTLRNPGMALLLASLDFPGVRVGPVFIAHFIASMAILSGGRWAMRALRHEPRLVGHAGERA